MTRGWCVIAEEFSTLLYFQYEMLGMAVWYFGFARVLTDPRSTAFGAVS